MLLIPPRSHCISNGAVTGKQGTKSLAAVSMGGCKRHFWSGVRCEILTDVTMWPTVCHRPTHPETLDRPGHQDNGPGIGNPALTGVKCGLETRANTGSSDTAYQNCPNIMPSSQALSGFEFRTKEMQCCVLQKMSCERFCCEVYLEPAFIRIQFNSPSNFQFW